MALALSPWPVAAAPAFAAPLVPAAAAGVGAGGRGAIHFEWQASAGTVSGDAALVDSSATNRRPGDVLFATPNPYRGAHCPCLAVAPLPPVGVQYSSGINSSLLNGKPGAVIQVTAVLNPGGKGAGVFDPHPVGVRYYPAQRKWAVLNEDGKKMPLGAAFNILVGTSASGGATSKVLTATASGELGRLAFFSSAASNDRPDSISFVTPDFNPGGKGGTLTGDPAGLYYYPTKSRWAVFDEGVEAPPPAGASYNLLIYPGS